MNIKFEPLLKNYGFDANAKPEWLMIPLMGEKAIWLIGEAGLTVSSTSPATATVETEASSITPNQRKLIIKGKMAGRTYIEVRQGRQVVRRLEVSVKPFIELRLSFHFVSDNAKNKDPKDKHSTNRTPGELKDMISGLNQIYTPQTNIAFQKKNHFFLELNKDLGDAVNFNYDFKNYKYMKGHEYDLVVSKRDKSAHINIFFVWRNEFKFREADGKISVSEPLGYASERNVVAEDWDGSMDRDEDNIQDNAPAWENARMLAHEIGHVLGIDDVSKTKKVKHPITHDVTKVVVNPHYVMGSGPFIPKHHANIMSAIAKQIAGR